jgi:hypothetical protein
MPASAVGKRISSEVKILFDSVVTFISLKRLFRVVGRTRAAWS